MQENNELLNQIITAIKAREEVVIDVEYPKMWDKWYCFTRFTDIGRIVVENDYLIYRDTNNAEIKGAFLKIDDEHYIQIYLDESKKRDITTVHIEIFYVSQLKNKIDVHYVQNNQQVDKEAIKEEIEKLDYFEIIDLRSKKR